MKALVPAIIPKSLTHLQTSLQAIERVHEVHIDIVDGKFVAPVSWPIEPLGNVYDLAEALEAHSVEVDIMTEKPLQQAEAWLAIGVDMIVVHVEALSVNEFASLTNMSDSSIGISALLDTPYETLRPYLELADYTQVMGIKTIGAQGQPFDERAIERVNAIAQDFPNLLISIDGSVNEDTIPKLRSLPASRFIVGSAIMGADKPEEAYSALKKLFGVSPQNNQ